MWGGGWKSGSPSPRLIAPEGAASNIFRIPESSMCVAREANIPRVETVRRAKNVSASVVARHTVGPPKGHEGASCTGSDGLVPALRGGPRGRVRLRVPDVRVRRPDPGREEA